MTGRFAQRRADVVQDRGVARLEAFSDGVFAFAATLLALGIRIPRPDDGDASTGLAALLVAQWPAYFAFALSFLSVGIVWANHHAMFGLFIRTDRGVVFLNLLNLMVVAFLPVSTAVLGNWLASDRDRLTAVLLYGATLTLFGIVHNMLWWYAAYRARVTTPDLSARERRSLTLGWSLGPLLYALMMAIAAVDPRYSIAGFALIHVLYLLPTARLVASVQRVRQKRTGAEPRRSRT